MNRPSPLCGVRAPERAEMTLPDGVTLVADVWRPEGRGEHPVLLMRQPYGRAIASTVVLAHPSWYAAHGYVVVVQDVRGCGGSGGRFDALRQEVADGAAALDWAAGLSGGNGRLGLYGFSYQATSQYLALAGGGRRPDAMAPAMGSWSPRGDWAFEGGAFRLASSVGWAMQMARRAAAHAGDAQALGALDAARDVHAQEASLTSRPDLSHLARWLDDDHAYWAAASPAELLAEDALGMPVLHTGGLCDLFLAGTLAADAAFAARAPERTHLILGPWGHIPWGRIAGSVPLPASAEISIDRRQVAFFNHYLKHDGPPPPRLTAYDSGTGTWSDHAAWPRTAPLDLHPGSSGLAAAMTGDGILGSTPTAGEDTIVADPTRPAPLVGGHLGTPPGPVDRGAADSRADVAVYSLPPADRPLHLCGTPRLSVDARASHTPFHVCATLSVTSSEATRVLSTGYARCAASGLQRLALHPINITLAPGEGLRLSLQGAGHPAVNVLHAPGEQPLQKGAITITFRHGETTRLTLPVATVEGFRP